MQPPARPRHWVSCPYRAVIPRRHPTARDVRIEILFCGVCHSDLHYTRDEWHDAMPTVYPAVPGHEIICRVMEVAPLSANTRRAISSESAVSSIRTMAKQTGSFDFILDCVEADHDINAYINLLKRDGNITLVGAPEKPLSVGAFGLIMGRRSLSGSPIGGLAETQEMLDFCGEHNIASDVEIIPIQEINESYDRILKSDVKYLFSIDMAPLKAE